MIVKMQISLCIEVSPDDYNLVRWIEFSCGCFSLWIVLYMDHFDRLFWLLECSRVAHFLLHFLDIFPDIWRIKRTRLAVYFDLISRVNNYFRWVILNFYAFQIIAWIVAVEFFFYNKNCFNYQNVSSYKTSISIKEKIDIFLPSFSLLLCFCACISFYYEC